jgi:hypothetical protein
VIVVVAVVIIVKTIVVVVLVVVVVTIVIVVKAMVVVVVVELLLLLLLVVVVVVVVVVKQKTLTSCTYQWCLCSIRAVCMLLQNYANPCVSHQTYNAAYPHVFYIFGPHNKRHEALYGL